MRQGLRNFILLSLFFVVLFSEASLSRTVINNKIYTGPAGTNSDPDSGSPWQEAAGGWVTLPVGTTISIGLTNMAVKENKKTVTISFTGDNADEDIRITGASGTDANGQGVKTYENAVGCNPGIERTAYQYTFDPQPEYEVFQVMNTGSDGCTFKTEAMSSCRRVREPEVAIAEAEENEIVMEAVVIQQNGGATITVDQIGIWSDNKTADTNEPGELIPPDVNDPCAPSNPTDPNTPTGTWTRSYLTMEPGGGGTLPQGGWKWSCGSYNRGIWEKEEFGLSMTTTGLAGGEYWLAVHDKLRGQWYKFLCDEKPVTHLRGDVTEDGFVNFKDFAQFAGQWLSEGAEQCYVVWSAVCPNCVNFEPASGNYSKSTVTIYEEHTNEEVTKGSGGRGDIIIRTEDLGEGKIATWTYECNDKHPCCGNQINCFGTVTMIPEGLGHTEGAKLECNCP